MDDRICDDCICQVCDRFGDNDECLHGNPCDECSCKVATAYCPWYSTAIRDLMHIAEEEGNRRSDDGKE